MCIHGVVFKYNVESAMILWRHNSADFVLGAVHFHVEQIPSISMWPSLINNPELESQRRKSFEGESQIKRKGAKVESQIKRKGARENLK